MSDIAFPLIGHDALEAEFLSAVNSGKLHHGWMIEGPSGIGKLLMAKRFAMYLLGARGSGDNPLDASVDDDVISKVISGGHPDIRIIERQLNDKGKLKQDINVSQIRELTHFFELKPGLGGWRVGIIDSLDEMNRNAENALLKTLEEPSHNCALFLINHGTETVLPTIRSRCRVMRAKPLSDDDTVAVLNRHGAPAQAADVADGRPGRGIALASPSGLRAASAARDIVKSIPRIPEALVASAVQAASADEIALDAFVTEIMRWLKNSALKNPAYAAGWIDISKVMSERRKLNMDTTQTVSKLIATLYQMAPQK
ncbi:MAG: DNA polymerase III subunit delta' [Hyphomonas sp.]